MAVTDVRTNSLTPSYSNAAVERMYVQWDKALSDNDPEALLACYAEDAVLEGPLVPHLMGGENGACRGHAELRRFFDILAQRKPPIRRYFRTGFFTDGKHLIWEYPREAPDGEQMDFVEAMVLNDKGLIQRHCVYWGWKGVSVLQQNKYHKCRGNSIKPTI
jgi:hypothetical protein